MIAILLVMGAVAWVRDGLAERARVRHVTELAKQHRRGDLADERNGLDGGTDQERAA